VDLGPVLEPQLQGRPSSGSAPAAAAVGSATPEGRNASSHGSRTGPPAAAVGGVGGRQGRGRADRRGGGYLSSRGISNFRDPSRDPRLDELRAMGLPAGQLRIAEEIGHDAFIAMWRVADNEPSFRTEKGDLEIRMRPYRSYLRFQRNRYIETLHGQGKTLDEIRELVHEHLCERISARHIRRLVSGD
jgi:hypothetical protein